MGSRTIDMTTGSPAKHILSFAVPLIAEPASWLGAMLCVSLPYLYYRKKYLE